VTEPPRTPDFRPVDGVRNVSLSDSTAARISEMIQSGELAPGARLPAERELAAMLSVSRTALREGLHVLETMGLLEARVGRGRFVASEISEKNPPRITSWMQLHHTQDVIDVRRVLEPEAIRQLDPAIVLNLGAQASRILGQMEQAQERGAHATAADFHTQFHALLLQSTPNHLLRGLCMSMVEVSRDSQDEIARTQAAGVHSLALHRVILDALNSGSLEEVANAVANHLVPVFTYPA
jgi:GntR family transcriptional repressor for pyruvate dehydrogenase complex